MSGPSVNMQVPNTDFERLRQEVAALDQLIVQTLAKRVRLSEEAVKFKVSPADITNPALAEMVVGRARAWASELGLPATLVQGIYNTILEHSVQRQLALFKEGRGSVASATQSEPD